MFASWTGAVRVYASNNEELIYAACACRLAMYELMGVGARYHFHRLVVLHFDIRNYDDMFVWCLKREAHLEFFEKSIFRFLCFLEVQHFENIA